ncbi:Heavy-metal-associated domain [Musa troglodytarum]|uniref:Heavy-metal-associated domain n=1 Tax=Musa troglodytarum TaxID=320322 RepID=A0A9E7EJF3_9LILI|nr:Heavy-metal-associated domain [Musa troglodytarum]URD78114.1 Heavy-metal-associated domain [Musa troglodytarum]
MATALGRALDSLLSIIYYPFGYHRNHLKRYSNSYFYTKEKSNGRKMSKGRPLSLQTVELKVRMCCTGCERVVKQALLKLRGVDSVEVDLELEKVTVTGYVERNKVLKEVRRSGKKAEFWPNPDLPLYFTTEKNYFHDVESFRGSYNYWRHGYNGDRHGHVPVPQRGEDAVSNMFNDDDVNACSVM